MACAALRSCVRVATLASNSPFRVVSAVTAATIRATAVLNPSIPVSTGTCPSAPCGGKLTVLILWMSVVIVFA